MCVPEGEFRHRSEQGQPQSEETNRTKRDRRLRSVFALTIGIAFLIPSGCRQDMHDQPKYESLEIIDFFGNAIAPRVPPEGTVARGWLQEDELLHTGKTGGRLSEIFPFPITRERLSRGQERYNIYCSPCHDRVGTGRGMIVQRGLKQPPSFHIVRLKEAAPGYFFDVITNGFGAMYSYASRVPAEDRWAIIAYIRALQLSQGANYDEVSEEDLGHLGGEGN